MIEPITATTIGLIIASVVVLALILAMIFGAILKPMGNELQYRPYPPQGRVDKIFGDEVPGGWGIIQLPPILWDVDGAAGATKGTNGTNGQWVRTGLTFAVAAANDLAFTDFVIPPDYNQEKNLLYLLLWVNANDTNPAHHGDWDGTVRRVPLSSNESDDAVAADAAQSGLTKVAQLTDDTALEVYGVKIDLGGVMQFHLLDWVQVCLWQDIATGDLGATPIVHQAVAIYKK